jgi:hypothetical protein
MPNQPDIPSNLFASKASPYSKPYKHASHYGEPLLASDEGLESFSCSN